MNWQPIETAPKERTPILLGRAGMPVQQGRWYDVGDEPGWYSDNIGALDYTPNTPPTHWMPLPPPPKDIQGDDKP